MMSADVAQTNLAKFDAIDYENYSDGGFIPLPDEGKYVGKVPALTDESFDTTAEGYLKLKLDPIVIVGPQGAGYKIRFTNLSAKKYSNREGSQVMDFLRACGIPLKPKSLDELKTACKMASNRTFQFGLTWEVYNKETKEAVKGRSALEATKGWNSEGRYLVDEFDATKKWYANGKVRYYVSAIQK
jgi:hypothetical protein